MPALKITALVELTSTQNADLLAIVDDVAGTPITKKITVGNLLSGAGGSTITVTDESADSTCFPIFVTSATGVLGPKSNVGLTFNSVTGDLSATRIAGILAPNLLDKGATEIITGAYTFNTLVDCSAGLLISDGSTLTIRDSTNTDHGQFSHTGTDFNLSFLNTTSWNILNAVNYKFDNSIFILEKAAANVDVVTLGQFWVRNDTPNTPMFTDDGGTDFELNASGGTTITVQTEGIDTTCFPIFTTAATGVLGPKSSAFLTYDSVLGDLHATRIAGILKGNLLDKSATETVAGAYTFTALANFDNGLRINGGNVLQIRDSTDTDFANFSHTGTDFNTTFTNTSSWNISSATNYKFDNSIFILEKAAANADAVALGQFWVRNDTPNTPMFTDDAGTDFVLNAAAGALITVADESADTTCFPIFVTEATGALGPKSSTGLTFNSSTGDLSATRIAGILAANLLDKTASETFSGSLTISNLLNCNGGVDVLAGGTLKIFNSTNTDHADFSHDGTDFNTAFTNTVDWNITGATRYLFDNHIFITENAGAAALLAGLGQFWVRNDTPNTPMFTDDSGTDFELNASAGTTITIVNEDVDTTCFPMFVTAATGVLGPKSNAGLIFDSATGDLSATLIAGIANANLLDKAASETISGSFTFSNLINCDGGVDVRGGTALKIFDTANTDRGEFSHDGTDFNLAFTNTADWNITNATNYKFDNSVFITEKAAANADVVALGQFWVRDDTPNIPMFTDDAGTDFELNAAGGTTITVANESVDSTCFPVFVTAATGSLGPKSNTGLTFNSATGDFSATLIAGIANANLLDKSASETFSGSLTISNVLNLNGGIDVLAGGTLKIFDSGNTDRADFSHDGTDFNLAFTNTADWNITGATNYKFDNNVFISEKSVANADVAGLGQFWVRDDAPNTPMFTDDAGTDHVLNPTESFIIAISDETTDLTTGTKVTFRMPYAFVLTEVRASLTTATTGANLIVDINEGGTTVLSTKISIDTTEKTSVTAATPPVISDSSLADDAEMTFDIDQVGSTIPGAGAKVELIGRRVA